MGPVLCIDCQEVSIVSPSSLQWLQSAGWEVWMGGCRCPRCAVRKGADRQMAVHSDSHELVGRPAYVIGVTGANDSVAIATDLEE